jgi:hypothetical protein
LIRNPLITKVFSDPAFSSRIKRGPIAYSMTRPMGAIANILDSTPRRSETRGLAGVLAGLAAIALLAAASGFAGSDPIPSDHSVSTSPSHLANRGLDYAQPSKAMSRNDPPLTRAATQLRMDEMSPTRWLSRFGRVSVAHRE